MNYASSSLLKQLILACSVAGIVACGGGGDDDNNNPGPGPILPGAAPVTVSSTAIGDVLTGVGTVQVLVPDQNNQGQFMTQTRNDLNGFTLYTFDADMPGMSACVDSDCVTAWPPLLADDDDQATSPFTIVMRDDGTRQWAIRDKPLYYFFQDMQAGDTNGEGANNIWRVATTQPVLRNLNDPNTPDPDSDYLVSSGSVLTYVQAVDGDDSTYVPQRLTVDRLTLYTFDPDLPNTPVCNPVDTPNCLVNWPPLMADANDVASGPYSLVDLKIDDQGNTAKMWALNGQPLYFYVEDVMATGGKIGATKPNWRLARPQPYQEVSAVNVGSFLAGSGNVQTLLPDPNNQGQFIQTTVGKEDFSVYTFDADMVDVLNPANSAATCQNGCLVNWPPVIADPNADPQPPYSLVQAQNAPDGVLQWAINGKPLYYFIQDMQAGDIVGDNVQSGNGATPSVNGYWNVARAAPVRVANNGDQGILLASEGPQVDLNGALVDPITQVQPQGVGFTLYTFDLDPVGGISTCTGDCLVSWPALYAAPNAVGFGDYTIVPRPEQNSARQWAYKGKPLYYYIGDDTPNVRVGETIGQTPANNDTGSATGGQINNWTIARP